MEQRSQELQLEDPRDEEHRGATERHDDPARERNPYRFGGHGDVVPSPA